MKNLKFVIMVLLVVLISVSRAYSFTEIVNKEELQQRLGVVTSNIPDLSQVKIAILDNGFRGFESGKGMLPDSAEYIAGPLNMPSSSSHGLGMAQIVWSVTGQKPNGPKMFLINSNGFSNFKAAVDFVIEHDIDIVLYSQIWTFGSNFDGKGFINEAVNRATSKGIIWINAAGNLGGHVHNGKVLSSAKNLKLNNKLDENNFTVTLTWNDFSDSEKECSKKDLDLQIYDSKNILVRSSQLIQKGQAPDPKDPSDSNSCFARETISVSDLGRGDYTVKVVPKSDNFSVNDAFRIIITDDRPDSLEFTDHTVGYEIMPPADNQNVITVGDKSPQSSVGPTIDGKIKPDFLIENSKVAFSNGNQTSGSSNAAAMLAGAVTVLKGNKADLSLKELQNYAQTLRKKYFVPSGLLEITTIPLWLSNLIPTGGMAKLHPVTGRIIIFSATLPTDIPWVKVFNIKMNLADDIVACSETMNFCALYPHYQDLYLGPPMIEYRQYIINQSNSAGVWVNPPKIQ